ncbi:nicotinamide riboside transporter PnuC [Sandarakinorhabdus sp.]|uniref:nicotinamide riboside transporter PnuC n=1 Tax=Sandarakinorhabdus sp. TaxID=1916663 RepID=UPI00286D911B|nr:nicotinamide riboside transporter PnuC [Sandarakinorhabdus sp.]
MNPWELLASAFGLANMLLLARRSAWNFPCGMAMVAIFAVLFWQARLYAVAGLQLCFFVAQLHGLWAWRRSAQHTAGGIAVRRLPAARWPLVLIAGAAGSAGLAAGLAQTDAAAPLVDGAVAAWSLVAQALTNLRILESWPLWVGINIVSVWLYASQSLWVTAGLYGLFCGLALYSWQAWRRELPQLP